ncbi:MAG: BON domain-containing protein [Caulobacteraceae bacterium]
MTSAIALHRDVDSDQEVGPSSDIEPQLWTWLCLGEGGERVDLKTAGDSGPGEFRDEVEAELHSEPGIEAGGIQIAVRDGVAMVTGHVVTLTGEVEWQYQKTVAEHAVRRLPGIVDLVNNIKVRSRRVANDTQGRLQVVPSGDAEPSE